MPTVNSYATLTQAIADYTHRIDLTAGGSPQSDYFIQAALEQIQEDIPDLNFGNYIRPMEVAYGPVTVQGGVAPVPTDWLGAKLMTVSDGAGDSWSLIMKAAAWLYTTYPSRQPCGLPAYIARDVMAPAAFTGSITIGATMDSDITMDADVTLDDGGPDSGLLVVTAVASGVLVPGMIIAGAGLPTVVTQAVTIINQISGTPGGIGVYEVSNPVEVASESMTGGGEIFVFGPYPDSDYQIGGTYYAQIPMLSASNTTNWLTRIAPALLTAACLVEAANYISSDSLLARWAPKYAQKLKALVDMDKAERWSAGTMAIEVA